MELRQLIYTRDGGRCQSCGSQPKDFQIDHIQPLALGGDDTNDNMQTLCVPCHREKTRREFTGGSKLQPRAFTTEGAAFLASCTDQGR